MTNAALSKIAVDGMSSLLSERLTRREGCRRSVGGHWSAGCWLALIPRGKWKVIVRGVRDWQDVESETAPRLSAKRRRGAVFSVYLFVQSVEGASILEASRSGVNRLGGDITEA